MNIEFVPASVRLVSPVPEYKLIKTLAVAARTCYGHIEYPDADDTNIAKHRDLITRIYRRGHWSVFEHGHIQARIRCDRGVSHELVRHRIGVSFLQESTRYIRYKDTIQFILPWWWDDSTNETISKRQLFEGACRAAASTYESMLNTGAAPQAARAVLPNALATNLFLSANLREVFHILNLRLDAAAHPDMQALMWLFYEALANHYPFLFRELYKYEM
jgi:thymidylate synthase (FAD)